ncbi:MAG: hypothetical protein QM640_07805, partial [Niabella sp.]
MKKFLLIVLAVISLTATHAQQSSTDANRMQRLKALNEIKDPLQLKAELNKLSKSNLEDDLSIAYSFYSYKEMADEAEKVKKTAIKKFPKGSLAFQSKIEAISKIEDLDEKDRRLKELQKSFPKQNLGFVAYNMARAYAGKGNEAKMLEYADIFGQTATDGKGNKLTPSKLYGSIASGLVRSNPGAALKYLKPAVDEARISLDELEVNPQSNANLLMRVKSSYYVYLTGYMNALLGTKNPEAAYPLAVEAYKKVNSDTSLQEQTKASVRNVYTSILIETKRFKEALPLMEEAIIGGASFET